MPAKNASVSWYSACWMLRLILAASETEPATAVSIASVTFSEPAWKSAARTLAASACFFTNSRAASGTSMFWSLVNASVTGAKASLTVFSTELVSVVMGVSPSSGLSNGAHPVRIGPGHGCCGTDNGASQQRCCSAVSRIRDRWVSGQSACPAGDPVPGREPLVLDSPGQAVGLHLGRHLRHIVPEHDDIVLLAADVADMVAQ